MPARISSAHSAAQGLLQLAGTAGGRWRGSPDVRSLALPHRPAARVRAGRPSERSADTYWTIGHFRLPDVSRHSTSSVAVAGAPLAGIRRSPGKATMRLSMAQPHGRSGQAASRSAIILAVPRIGSPAKRPSARILQSPRTIDIRHRSAPRDALASDKATAATGDALDPTCSRHGGSAVAQHLDAWHLDVDGRGGGLAGAPCSPYIINLFIFWKTGAARKVAR